MYTCIHNVYAYIERDVYSMHDCLMYGQFSKFHVCFCGVDPGNLKFETVRTHKQHICF